MGLLVQPEEPEYLVRLELVDQQDRMVHLAFLARLVFRAQLVHKVKLVLPVCLAFKDQEDLWALVDSLDKSAPLARPDQLGQMESLVPEVRQVHWVLTALRVHREMSGELGQ